MRKKGGRIHRGFAAVDDRTVWTLELNRDELMIILNGIKKHRIKRGAYETRGLAGAEKPTARSRQSNQSKIKKKSKTP